MGLSVAVIQGRTLSRSIGRRSSGFTLVELLAATVLSAVLVVAMLLIVAGIGRDRREIARRAAADVPAELIEVLRWDLLSARAIEFRENGVLLSGYGSLDRQTLSPLSHRPAEVVYQVEELAGRPWLVRRQQEPGKPKTASAELVCVGVKEIRILPIEITDGPAKETQPTDPIDRRLSMTGQVRLSIAFDSEARKPIQETVVLR